MEKWEKASKHFADVILKPPPIFDYQEVPSEIPLEAKTLEEHDTTGRPWIRYFAKMIDISMFSILFGFLLGVVFPEFLNGVGNLVLSFLIVFLWSIIEPFFLVIFGNTLGRALMKTKIKTVSGGKINFSTAYRRNMSLWIRGFGLGLPLVSLICSIASYKELKNQGFTTWDAENNLITTHGKVGILRGTFTAVIVIGIILLSLVGEYSYQPKTASKNSSEQITTSETKANEDNTQIDSYSADTSSVADTSTSTNTSTTESETYDEFGFPSSGFFLKNIVIMINQVH